MHMKDLIELKENLRKFLNSETARNSKPIDPIGLIVECVKFLVGIIGNFIDDDDNQKP